MSVPCTWHLVRSVAACHSSAIVFHFRLGYGSSALLWNQKNGDIGQSTMKMCPSWMCTTWQTTQRVFGADPSCYNKRLGQCTSLPWLGLGHLRPQSCYDASALLRLRPVASVFSGDDVRLYKKSGWPSHFSPLHMSSGAPLHFSLIAATGRCTFKHDLASLHIQAWSPRLPQSRRPCLDHT